MSTDLRADIITALREQAGTMVLVANGSPGLLRNPTAWAMVTLTTKTLYQLADRIEATQGDSATPDSEPR